MRPIIVGGVCGRAHDEPLHPASQSGARLARLAGLTHDEFLARFDRINLLSGASPFVRLADVDFARVAAANLRPILRGRRVIMLGLGTANVLGFGGIPLYEWRRVGQSVVAVMPHPSSRNRHWNDQPAADVNASYFLRRSLMPCVHVEGPDGCGKSTLIPKLKDLLSRNAEMEIVPTEGPPESWADCTKRIDKRIAPGMISDRSSGLISELVYGPILRGGVRGDEADYWEILRTLTGAVTFIYCRPPLEMLRPSFRPEEPDDFASDVLANMAAIANRYDEIMQRIQAQGGRVILYDRTSMTPEDAARCVE